MNPFNIRFSWSIFGLTVFDINKIRNVDLKNFAADNPYGALYSKYKHRYYI